MSFQALDPTDFVVSVDSVTAGIWTDNTASLFAYYTSSTQAASSAGNYYLNVYDTAATNSIQFAATYGNLYGSGSELYNASVNGYSYSGTIWGQYQILCLGDENANFSWGGITGSDFWALSIERDRYKEALFPGSLSLTFKTGSSYLTITDDSQVVSSQVFCDAGRVFQLVSGSAGVVYSGSGTDGINGYSVSSGSYGWLLPDIGTILLNPLAISQSINLVPTRTSNTDGQNPARIINAISASGASNFPFTLNSQENIASDFIFCRPRSAQFNYSENPSFISGSTGEVLYDSFINNPQVYITTVGLYNDASELLAVAKLSRPLLKDFTKEALVRVKLDF
jgi:hypothetical protein